MSFSGPEDARSYASSPPQPILGLKRDVRTDLAETALVGLQHLLPSTTPLIQRLLAAGFMADHVFLLGKPYSTVPDVAKSLANTGCHVHLPGERIFTIGRYAEGFHKLVIDFWRTVQHTLQRNSTIKNMVILDEGGWLCRDVPEDVIETFNVTAVEHTMYGVFTAPAGGRPFPIILMASSAAKTRFENHVIADAIVQRLPEAIGGFADAKIGILGLGNIGQAVASTLHAKRWGPLLGFDVLKGKADDLKFLQRASRAELVAQCDIIMGCTGTDVLQHGAPLNGVQGRRWLASCSSGDVEFCHVARQLANRVPALRSDPFHDARGTIGATEVVLLNGGFPLNFDRTREREHPVRIQLTRELTFASVLQAALCLDESAGNVGVMLDPEIQQLLVEAWLKNAEAKALFPHWTPHAAGWWEKHSGGQKLPNCLGGLIGPAD